MQAALERERQRLTELQAGIGPAELRDRTALAEAIVSGRPEPAREADGLRADVEQQQRRIDALVAALSDAQAGDVEVVRENHSWARDQMREVAKARERYAAAIEELEQARDVFADETGALAWLLDPGSGQGSPVNAALAGRSGVVRGKPPLRMDTVVGELRADLAAVEEWILTRYDDDGGGPRLELAHRAEPGTWVA